ncbi:MAG: hypothetical protein ABJP45_04245 [Cyclobacteriaceae bacterium]
MEENNLIITSQDNASFLETAKWGKFLAIVGFVFSGIMIIVGFVTMAIPMPGIPFSSVFTGLLYIALTSLYIVPSVLLYRYSVRVKTAVLGGDQTLFSNALTNLRRLFVYYGILTVIILIIYMLAILIAVVAGSLA